MRRRHQRETIRTSEYINSRGWVKGTYLIDLGRENKHLANIDELF